MVTVLAGQKKKSFILHRKVLCENSRFFRKALSGPWQESEEGLVTLAEIDAMSLKAYVSWVYSHKLDRSILLYGSEASELLSDSEISTICEKASRGVSQRDSISTERREQSECVILVDRLARLWCHGDFLGDHRFQNAVMDELGNEIGGTHRSSSYVSLGTFRFLTDSTLPTCPLRKFFIDWLSNPTIPEKIQEAVEYGHVPNWLLAGLLRNSVPKAGTNIDSGNYHLMNVEDGLNTSDEGDESVEHED